MSRVVHFEMVGEDPERMAKFYADAFGWQAYCEDTEGNVFGIHQDDPQAK